MSAFLLDYVGTKEGREDLQQAGRDKAKAIYDLFSQHKTFHEYNSTRSTILPPRISSP